MSKRVCNSKGGRAWKLRRPKKSKHNAKYCAERALRRATAPGGLGR